MAITYVELKNCFRQKDWQGTLEQIKNESSGNFGIMVTADSSLESYVQDCFTKNKFYYAVLNITSNVISNNKTLQGIINTLKLIKSKVDFKYLLLNGTYKEIPARNSKGNWIGVDNELNNQDYPYVILNNIDLTTFNMPKLKETFKDGLCVGRLRASVSQEYSLPNKDGVAYYAQEPTSFGKTITKSIAKDCCVNMLSCLDKKAVYEFPDFLENTTRTANRMSDNEINSLLRSKIKGKGILQLNTHGGKVYCGSCSTKEKEQYVDVCFCSSSSDKFESIYIDNIGKAVETKYVIFTNACNATEYFIPRNNNLSVECDNCGKKFNQFTSNLCGFIGSSGTGYMLGKDSYWSHLQKIGIETFYKGGTMGESLINMYKACYDNSWGIYTLYCLVTLKLLGDPAFKA